MKIATDIKQSKQLAKILPIESADMFYGTIAPYEYSDRMYDGGIEDIPLPKNASKSSIIGVDEYDGQIPAWSLSALLEVMPFHIIENNQRYSFNVCKGLNKDGQTYMIKYNIFNTDITLHKTDYYNNPIDACVEMILYLKKENWLWN